METSKIFKKLPIVVKLEKPQSLCQLCVTICTTYFPFRVFEKMDLSANCSEYINIPYCVPEPGVTDTEDQPQG